MTSKYFAHLRKEENHYRWGKGAAQERVPRRNATEGGGKEKDPGEISGGTRASHWRW